MGGLDAQRKIVRQTFQTADDAIEETAQEILLYYTNAHPSESFRARRKVLDQAHQGY